VSYDVATRTTPVPFRICNYGAGLEGIKYGVLSETGKISDPIIEMDDFGSPDEVFLISKPIFHEELGEYYLAIRLEDMEEYGCVEDDNDAIYVVEILAISPRSCSVETLERACSDHIKDPDYDHNGPWSAYDLAHWGKCAHVWQACGDDKEELMREARKRIGKIQSLIGFFLDQVQNRCGDSGWSWIRDA
jgi:hypothetical protein